MAISALLTLLLYYYKSTTFSNSIKLVLAAVRFVAISLLLVLLLKPVIKYAQVFYEKPLLLVGIDNSKSMLATKDSVATKSEFSTLLKNLNSTYSNQFDVRLFALNESVEELDSDTAISFDGNETNLASFFEHVNDFYAFDNVGAVVLASDGIFNSGANPRYSNIKPNAPLFTVGVGNNTPQVDAGVVSLNSNEISFLNNKFPVQSTLKFSACKGKKVEAKLFAFGKVVGDTSFTVNSNAQSVDLKWLVKAEKLGLQKLKVEVSSITGEHNLSNNSAVEVIRIQDARQRILLTYEFPHPDISAVRLALANDQNYEVVLKSAQEILQQDKLADFAKNFSLIIAYQSPQIAAQNRIVFNKLLQQSIPIWLIGSSKTNYLKWFNADPMLTWKGELNKSNQVQPSINKNFRVFTTQSTQVDLPPVKVPFGVVKYSAGAQVLMHQSIGGIETPYPLWFFTKPEQLRGYFLGEGLWRWRLSEYEQNGNTKWFDTQVIKTVQYLASKKDLSKFRVKNKQFYTENEEVVIDVELYNDNYELINDVTVDFELINEDKLAYNHQFAKQGKGYALNLGNLTVGQYAFKASVNEAGLNYSKSSTFEVISSLKEYTNTQADFDLLNQLAVKNNGKFYSLKESNTQLITDLKELEAKTLSYEEFSIKNLIEEKWLFAILIFLFATEWLVRKREGVI